MLWIGTGSNNAIEFEVADAGKGSMFALAKMQGQPFGWGLEILALFLAATTSAMCTRSTLPVLQKWRRFTPTSSPGSYATKYRVARLETFVYVQGYYTDTWKTVCCFDMRQHGLTAANYATAKLGIYVNARCTLASVTSKRAHWSLCNHG